MITLETQNKDCIHTGHRAARNSCTPLTPIPEPAPLGKRSRRATGKTEGHIFHISPSSLREKVGVEWEAQKCIVHRNVSSKTVRWEYAKLVTCY